MLTFVLDIYIYIINTSDINNYVCRGVHKSANTDLVTVRDFELMSHKFNLERTGTQVLSSSAED